MGHSQRILVLQSEIRQILEDMDKGTSSDAISQSGKPVFPLSCGFFHDDSRFKLTSFGVPKALQGRENIPSPVTGKDQG